jgi:hypothetical protein
MLNKQGVHIPKTYQNSLILHCFFFCIHRFENAPTTTNTKHAKPKTNIRFTCNKYS